ncbi:MAG TPA: ACT domain-containing protein [Solirubrobacteraceae bacterium]|nr:ACT domain-containing protein [Solirubrobacteraceae bacterium]
MPALRLLLHPERYAVVKLRIADGLPAWFALDAAPVTAAVRRGDELSLVAPEDVVPEDAGLVERGFRALEVTGPLAFELTGVMASIAQPLADAGVWIFTLATYDTDVVLVPEAKIETAKAALRAAGHTVE